MQAQHAKSHLFTLRVWPEEIAEGQLEWRGKIQCVVGGETFYFRDWEAMMAFLLRTLQAEMPTTLENGPRRESDA